MTPLIVKPPPECRAPADGAAGAKQVVESSGWEQVSRYHTIAPNATWSVGSAKLTTAFTPLQGCSEVTTAPTSTPDHATNQALVLDHARRGSPALPCGNERRPLVATGAASEIAVLDLDRSTAPASGEEMKHGAADLDIEMQRNGQTLPHPPEVRASNVGPHPWFRQDVNFGMGSNSILATDQSTECRRSTSTTASQCCVEGCRVERWLGVELREVR